jgi:hypothetical protein
VGEVALKRLAGAIALAVLAGCARPEVPEDDDARTPRPLPDTLAHADTIVADLKKREAEQRALEEQMPKPSGQIPVVIEMPPAELGYRRPRYYQNYSVPALPASDEARWKSEARLLDIRLNTALKNADAALARMEAARTELDRRNSSTYEEAERIYAFAARDYDVLMREVDVSKRNIESLRDSARQAGVPPGWARWP